MTFSEIPFPESEKSLECKDSQSSATLAWEAVVLPIYESCMWRYYSKSTERIQALFVGGLSRPAGSSVKVSFHLLPAALQRFLLGSLKQCKNLIAVVTMS